MRTNIFEEWDEYAKRQREIQKEMGEAISNEFARKKAKRISTEISKFLKGR